ncbi:MAG: hypothetical protein EOP48_23710 [Sphingobacteriales bacterium]|nr:MAG: hypothetical protein EOP48_23710 [Sphingobacteriales bacterium]
MKNKIVAHVICFLCLWLSTIFSSCKEQEETISISFTKETLEAEYVQVKKNVRSPEKIDIEVDVINSKKFKASDRQEDLGVLALHSFYNFLSDENSSILDTLSMRFLYNSREIAKYKLIKRHLEQIDSAFNTLEALFNGKYYLSKDSIGVCVNSEFITPEMQEKFVEFNNSIRAKYGDFNGVTIHRIGFGKFKTTNVEFLTIDTDFENDTAAINFVFNLNSPDFKIFHIEIKSLTLAPNQGD